MVAVKGFHQKPDWNSLFLQYFRVKETDLDEANSGSQRGQMALVELAGDDGVLDQKLERNDLEGVFVGGFEDDRASGSGLLDL